MANPRTNDQYQREHRMLAEWEVDVQNAMETDCAAARQLAEMVVQLRGSTDHPIPSILSQFMQFYLGSRMLERAVAERAWSEAGDWVSWSMSDSICDGQIKEVFPSRLLEFVLNPALTTWPQFSKTIISWLCSFFYYARRRAAMRNVGIYLWPATMKIFQQLIMSNAYDEAANLGGFLLGWAAQECDECAVELTPAIEKLATSAMVPRRAQALSTAVLATNSGKFACNGRHIWAERSVDEFQSEMQGHERIQALVNLFEFRSDAQTIEAILAEIDVIQRGNNGSTISGRRAMDAFPDFILALCGICLLRGNSALLLTFLARWYGINSTTDLLESKEIILIAPFHNEGYILLADPHRIDLYEDRHTNLVRITAAADRFASTANSIAGADNDALHVPNRFGVPEQSLATDFENELLRAYFPGSIEDKVRSLDLNGRVQLIVPAVPHPLQAIQLRQLGRTWPITASLERAQVDRPIRRVVIWSGAGSMTESIEIEAIKALFESNGCAVDVHLPSDCMADEFMNVYRDPSIDLLWIVSHGEYNHWDPSSVTIQIGSSGNHIGLDVLISEPIESKSRRLLVLNVCDGGRFEQTGVLPRVGFAPALANRGQAVVSHLWPVRGIPAAAFGALLAVRLAQGESYFAAFEGALLDMRSPTDAVVQTIEAEIGFPIELSTRIRRSAEDLDNFASAGSAVFYQ